MGFSQSGLGFAQDQTGTMGKSAKIAELTQYSRKGMQKVKMLKMERRKMQMRARLNLSKNLQQTFHAY